MKLFTAALAGLAAGIMLGGCATQPPEDGQKLAQGQRHVPTGTAIPRKKGQVAGNVGNLDMTAVENARIMEASRGQRN